MNQFEQTLRLFAHILIFVCKMLNENEQWEMADNKNVYAQIRGKDP